MSKQVSKHRAYLAALARFFLHNERGVTAMEYGLIAFFVAVGILVALLVLGGSLEAMYNSVKDTIINVL